MGDASRERLSDAGSIPARSRKKNHAAHAVWFFFIGLRESNKEARIGDGSFHVDFFT